MRNNYRMCLSLQATPYTNEKSQTQNVDYSSLNGQNVVNQLSHFRNEKKADE